MLPNNMFLDIYWFHVLIFSVTKFVLYMLCRRIHTGSVQALAQDHRNDVLSNSIAVVFGYVGELLLELCFKTQYNVDGESMIYVL